MTDPLRRSLGLSLVLLLACSRPDPTLGVLAHRQTYSVTLRSWVPRDGRVLVEVEVLPRFKPEIDSLTIRIVAFDGAGGEVTSRRVAVPVRDLQTGLPATRRLEVDLRAEDGGLGVEVEPSPPAASWNEFPELSLSSSFSGS